VVLAVAEFPPLGGGGVIRMAKLARYLAQIGWSVRVITSDEPLAHAVDRTLLDDLPESVEIVKIRPPLHGVGRAMTQGAKERLSRRGSAFRLLRALRQRFRNAIAIPDRWLPWSLTFARTELAGNRAGAMVSSGPPHSVHIGASILAWRSGIPHVMDMRDEWTLRPLMRSGFRLRAAAERRIERWCLRRADTLVVVSEESRDRYSVAYPDVAHRIVVIPNGYDPQDFEGIPSRPRRRRSTVTLGYAGTFQVGTEIEPLLAAVGDLTRSGVAGRAVRFELLGPFLPEEVDVARKHIPPGQLVIRPFAVHREALRLMSDWDALCVIATDGPASLASKMYECLALRRPIVVIAHEGPATRLVHALKVGAVADPHDRNSIRDAMTSALAMSGPGFEGASDDTLALYDRRRQAGQWSDLLDQLIGAGVTHRAGR